MCVQIAAKKGRLSTSRLITGVPPVTFTAGSPVSVHTGVGAPLVTYLSGQTLRGQQ